MEPNGTIMADVKVLQWRATLALVDRMTMSRRELWECDHLHETYEQAKDCAQEELARRYGLALSTT